MQVQEEGGINKGVRVGKGRSWRKKMREREEEEEGKRELLNKM